MPMTFSNLSRALAALMMVLACTLALALPTPKDINAAVEAGDFKRAETLLREVLAEKPNSAKAHYQLGEVLARETRYDEALAQLKQARAIDPALKFASSPEKFQQVLDKVDAAAASGKAVTPTPASPAATSAAPERRESGFPTGYVVGGILLIVLVVVLIRRSNAATRASQDMYVGATPYGAGNPMAAQPGYGRYGPGGNMAPQPGYGAPQGSGMGGAVIGGVAGLAAGYALSKALDGGHESNAATSRNDGNGSGYVPMDNPAPDLGSFDSGSGGGWDNAGDSDSGGDSGGGW
ncbi:MAG: tetratricopeptide repeat protein [Betaproteobacteria bacterium]|nr:tetratricopeptide repeat protein [Betaproteobacteria bacterium]